MSGNPRARRRRSVPTCGCASRRTACSCIRQTERMPPKSAAVEDGGGKLDRVGRRADDEGVRAVVRVRGIGEWTAHMFVMLQLGRLDVWPVLDFGVRMGYSRLFGCDPPLTAKQLASEGDRFRP